jgi:hypothetical protein
VSGDYWRTTPRPKGHDDRRSARHGDGDALSGRDAGEKSKTSLASKEAGGFSAARLSQARIILRRLIGADPSKAWLKSKNPLSEAVRREREGARN